RLRKARRQHRRVKLLQLLVRTLAAGGRVVSPVQRLARSDQADRRLLRTLFARRHAASQRHHDEDQHEEVRQRGGEQREQDAPPLVVDAAPQAHRLPPALAWTVGRDRYEATTTA